MLLVLQPLVLGTALTLSRHHSMFELDHYCIDHGQIQLGCSKATQETFTARRQ